jgi:hypothetical protein
MENLAASSYISALDMVLKDTCKSSKTLVHSHVSNGGFVVERIAVRLIFLSAHKFSSLSPMVYTHLSLGTGTLGAL